MPTCVCIFSVLSHFSMHPSLLIWVFTIYYVFQVHFFERNCFRTQESKTSVLWLCERSSLAHEENTDTFQDLYWIISFGPTSQQCYSSSTFAFACGCLIHCSSVLRDRSQGQGDNFSFLAFFCVPTRLSCGGQWKRLWRRPRNIAACSPSFLFCTTRVCSWRHTLTRPARCSTAPAPHTSARWNWSR